MSFLKSILEPSGWSPTRFGRIDSWYLLIAYFHVVIVAIFTIGNWINRQRVTWDDELHTPLLKNDDADDLEPDHMGAALADEAIDAAMPSERYPPNIPTRILARYPFLLEIWYWLLTYWA